jgi:hypothetical protein
MKKVLMYLASCQLFSLLSTAQVFIEQGPVGTSRDGQISVYGMNGTNPRIRYEKIKGSAFYNPEWLKAELSQPDGKSFGTYPVRLNLATHEVHFTDKKGYELAANDNSVAKVVFIDSTNTGKPRKTFRNDYEGVTTVYGKNKKYAEELNEGHFGLLKVTIREGREADSMFGTMKRYYFIDRIDYFVRSGRRVEKVRKLTEDEVMTILPGNRDAVEYIKKNKLNLKKEEDVIRLFDYLNLIRKPSN